MRLWGGFRGFGGRVLGGFVGFKGFCFVVSRSRTAAVTLRIPKMNPQPSTLNPQPSTLNPKP